MFPLAKILLVDDEADFLASIQSILEDEGYDVITAENGTRALHLVEEQKPDLVLTDIVMPDVSGLQLAQSIRQSSSKLIPIISMTGYPFQDELGPNGLRLVDIYLTKPLQVSDLLTALALCLEGR
ncbi:MAG: response regulator [Proteobacteria bacterium]|nr:MAG: response regulator [Pseudomonadota bacterium]